MPKLFPFARNLQRHKIFLFLNRHQVLRYIFCSIHLWNFFFRNIFADWTQRNYAFNFTMISGVTTAKIPTTSGPLEPQRPFPLLWFIQIFFRGMKRNDQKKWKFEPFWILEFGLTHSSSQQILDQRFYTAGGFVWFDRPFYPVTSMMMPSLCPSSSR